MPKKIDPKVKERCVRQVLEHLPEYSSVTAAAEVAARREVLGKELVRRWVIQAPIDGGQRQGATSKELADITEPKARVRRLEEDNEVLRRASIFFFLRVNATLRVPGGARSLLVARAFGGFSSDVRPRRAP